MFEILAAAHGLRVSQRLHKGKSGSHLHCAISNSTGLLQHCPPQGKERDRHLASTLKSRMCALLPFISSRTLSNTQHTQGVWYWLWNHSFMKGAIQVAGRGDIVSLPRQSSTLSQLQDRQPLPATRNIALPTITNNDHEKAGWPRQVLVCGPTTYTHLVSNTRSSCLHWCNGTFEAATARRFNS